MNKYAYILYENKHTKNRLENKPIIEIKEWDANPLACIEFDKLIYAFDLTGDN